ncbi:MAG TPA: S41 family peptidase [Bacteroidales bacterium]|nr:S41 family peptidase [Bacteroidales bacterium]
MKGLYIAIVLLILTSCSEIFLGEDESSTPRENFEYLWNFLDKKYSLFAYKNIDWDQMYEKYSPLVKNSMSDAELFDVLFSMLSELRDAHVNLVSPFNVSRYDAVFAQSPENYNERLVEDYYLKKDYFETGPFKHQLIARGRVGYVRYSSFSSSMERSDIDFIIDKYRNSKGIIMDVRSNGGGFVSNVFTLCSAFADIRRHVYTSYIKTGPGHEDFSEAHNVFISPSSNEPFAKPVVVLTNRGCYSATSFFVLAMREFPNVITMGDTTGGGLGAPTGAELPNGWSFRFSCTRTISSDGMNYEDGIPPDKLVYMTKGDEYKGFDTIIESAIAEIVASNR